VRAAFGQIENGQRFQVTGHDVGKLALDLQVLFPTLDEVRAGKGGPELMAMHQNIYPVNKRLSLDEATLSVITDSSLVRWIVGDCALHDVGLEGVCLETERLAIDRYSQIAAPVQPLQPRDDLSLGPVLPAADLARLLIAKDSDDRSVKILSRVGAMNGALSVYHDPSSAR